MQRLSFLFIIHFHAITFVTALGASEFARFGRMMGKDNIF